MKYIDLILSILIGIFIYLLLQFFDSYNENFQSFLFKCIPKNNTTYMTNINDVKKNLENDGYIITKSYESIQLLNIYDILLCDLNNKINDMKIIDFLNLNDNEKKKESFEIINIIFEKVLINTEKLLESIISVNNQENFNKYSIPNTNLLNNIKQEMLITN